jgi:N-acetylmuramoyl-L-alanine amidase
LSSRHLRVITTLAGAGLAALVALLGCGTPAGLPRDPADVPGYQNAPPDLAGVDPAPLRGRRILLDPGHGGYFRGAVGDQGLTEAEVNLGVALYLQGLLQWAGADVHLTRTADVDFLTPADSSLTGDLAARVAICDSLQPDVFLSIHHNSTAERDPTINETQTYYPLGRDGADLDLARAIHRQLVLALEIEPARILPGGFHVLRHAPMPAVLGEPAMISNPVIEGRLTLARSLELEAAAYFLGLREYFAAGTPRWWTDLPDTLLAGGDLPAPSWVFDPGGATAPTLDPASVRVLLDGRPIAPSSSADGQRIDLPASVVARPAHLEIRGRNLAGRAAPVRHHVVLAADAGRRPSWPGPPPEPLPAGVRWISLTADPNVWPASLVPGGQWRRRGDPSADAPLPGSPAWPAVAHADGSDLWLEADGAHPLLVLAASKPDTAATGAADSLAWRPLLPALIGVRVALDPRGGGVDDDGRGPLGMRGSELNLQVAERLAALLRGAGAAVTLVRDGDQWVPDPERIRRADIHGADLYLALGRGIPGARHHPGSTVGAPWAEACAAAIDPLVPDTTAVTAAYDYVLRHTACPAVLVTLEPPATAPVEARLVRPAWQDAVARALFGATVTQLDPTAPPVAVADLLDALDARAIPRHRLDLVRLDGNFQWLPPSGQPGAAPLPSWGAADPGLPLPGDRHVLELRAGAHWQLWELHPRPEGTWRGQLLLENR